MIVAKTQLSKMSPEPVLLYVSLCRSYLSQQKVWKESHMTVESSKIAKKERKVVLVVLVIIPCFFLCVFFFGFLCHFSVQRGGEFLFPMECPSQHWTTGWWQGDNDGDDCSNIGPGKEEEESIWNEAPLLSIKDSNQDCWHTTCFFPNVIFFDCIKRQARQQLQLLLKGRQLSQLFYLKHIHILLDDWQNS